jgi:hypothetical protein
MVGASYIDSLYSSDSLLAVSIRGQKWFGLNKLQVFLGNNAVGLMDRFIFLFRYILCVLVFVLYMMPLATPALPTLNKRLCSLLGIYYSLYFSRPVPFAFVPSEKMGMPSYTTCHSSCPAGSLYRLLFFVVVFCAPMYCIYVVFYNHKDGPTGRLADWPLELCL